MSHQGLQGTRHLFLVLPSWCDVIAINDQCDSLGIVRCPDVFVLFCDKGQSINPGSEGNCK